MPRAIGQLSRRRRADRTRRAARHGRKRPSQRSATSWDGRSMGHLTSIEGALGAQGRRPSASALAAPWTLSSIKPRCRRVAGLQTARHRSQAHRLRTRRSRPLLVHSLSRPSESKPRGSKRRYARLGWNERTQLALAQSCCSRRLRRSDPSVPSGGICARRWPRSARPRRSARSPPLARLPSMLRTSASSALAVASKACTANARACRSACHVVRIHAEPLFRPPCDGRLSGAQSCIVYSDAGRRCPSSRCPR